MSQQRDWSNPADWADMLGYEPADFAAEYVLCNEQFIAECSALLKQRDPQPGKLIGTPEFAARWGLRFRCKRWRTACALADRLVRACLSSRATRDKI